MYAYHQQVLKQINIEQILQIAPHFSDFFAFETPDHQIRFGLGTISQLTPDSPQSAFADVKQWQITQKAQIPKVIQNQAQIFGAYPFENQPSQQHNIWGSLARGYFFLPQYTLIQQATATFELLVLTQGPQQLSQAVSDFLNILALNPNALPATPNLDTQQALDLAHWQQQVGNTVAKLQHQDSFKKVVLARALTTTSTGAISPEKSWLNARAINPETYHILLRHQGLAFLSATPERLIQFNQTHFKTAAIAGTMARGKTPAEDRQLGNQLLSDPKNRQEQAFVTKTILAILHRHHAEVQYQSRPTLLKNKNVQHLCTPITGQIPTPAGIFDLIADLHPTPALGGVPKAQALAQIQRIEPLKRGLFGAPIGYLTFDHVGEFAVGIRSALLKTHQATLFAGAGIVADSVPAKEVKETALKFQPMLNTLYERTNVFNV
ncbi:MAG: isochorismate synthase [Lactobacillus sp.]|jgi:menaquinone-specific isochorismate synthase|nr:isochorismate synthase [Lactobacillus sp.]